MRGAIRKSSPHRQQTCCAIKSRGAKAAMPSPQCGHRSRKPQPCSKHEMRVAQRQRRRKYGASSPARQAGQNCNQVAALRLATWRSGNSSRIPGPAPSVIIAIRARATPVCRWRTSRVPIRQRAIAPRRPHASAKPEDITEMARRNTVRQRQPVQPTGQPFVVLRRDRHRPAIGLKFAVARLGLDDETRAGPVTDRHDRYSRF
jgi:hypothetical protein